MKPVGPSTGALVMVPAGQPAVSAELPALIEATEKISNARDSLDDPTDKDQGVAPRGDASNIAPLDANGLAYSRSAADVLNIVYLNSAAVSQGGFFPNGVNGTIRTSSAF